MRHDGPEGSFYKELSSTIVEMIIVEVHNIFILHVFINLFQVQTIYHQNISRYLVGYISRQK